MDPYRTLGVTKGCSRAEVKEAFRTRVAYTHPDRGGQELDFIQLRAAYEQILAEIDRNPRAVADRSVRPGQGNATATPLVPTGAVDLVLHQQAAYAGQSHRPPDPVAAREASIAWFQHLSAEAARKHPKRRFRILGPIFLFYLAFLAPVALLLFTASIVFDVEKYARMDGWDSSSLQVFFGIAVHLCSWISAWLLVRYAEVS